MQQLFDHVVARIHGGDFTVSEINLLNCKEQRIIHEVKLLQEIYILLKLFYDFHPIIQFKINLICVCQENLSEI